MNSRAKRYQTLLRQVARELDEKPNSEVVKHVSTFRLLRENQLIRLLAGERVDPADILKVDEALKQYLPQGKPLSVKVVFVNGTRVCCPGCKLEFDPHTDKSYEPSPPPTFDAKPVIDGEPVKALPQPKPPKTPDGPQGLGPGDDRGWGKVGSVHDGNAPIRGDQIPAGAAQTNNYLGGFSSGREAFGQARWPNPSRDAGG
jgi:hypothetical protein